VGGTAFDHLVAESGARHDERREMCAEPHHDDEIATAHHSWQQLRQLRNIDRNPSRFVAREHFSR
jgi:hypothetical protein